MKINKSYLFWFLLLLAVEIFIATFIKDQMIRPFVGDIIVVILIYCFVSTILNSAGEKNKTFSIAFVVLIFAFAIEFLQAANILEYFGLYDNTFFRIVLGSVFDYWDLLAYSIGFGLILLLENRRKIMFRK